TSFSSCAGGGNDSGWQPVRQAAAIANSADAWRRFPRADSGAGNGCAIRRCHVEGLSEIIAIASGGTRAAPTPGGNRGYNVGSAQRAPDQRRVAPHCMVVNLV